MTIKKTLSSSGDCGYCTLINGRKIKKNHKLITVYARIDDVICHLGLAKVNFTGKNKKFISAVTRIQKDLILLNGHLYNGKKSEGINTLTAFLDKKIIELGSKTKPIKNFVIAGRNKTEVAVHIARSKTRLAEISAVEFGKSKPTVKYLNHLSKYLFLLALNIQ